MTALDKPANLINLPFFLLLLTFTIEVKNQSNVTESTNAISDGQYAIGKKTAYLDTFSLTKVCQIVISYTSMYSLNTTPNNSKSKMLLTD